jgi:hypothetical protein
MHEVRAPLTVGADGRFSKVRHLAGFEPIKTSSPMDILWFRLPRLAGDLPEAEGRFLGGFGGGRVLAVFDRFDYWQVAYVFPKGHYQDLRAAGLESLRQSIVGIEPRLAEHVKDLTDWHQFSLLSVESSRCPRWYKPGCGGSSQHPRRSTQGRPPPGRGSCQSTESARVANPSDSGHSVRGTESDTGQRTTLADRAQHPVVRPRILQNTDTPRCPGPTHSLRRAPSSPEGRRLQRRPEGCVGSRGDSRPRLSGRAKLDSDTARIVWVHLPTRRTGQKPKAPHETGLSSNSRARIIRHACQAALGYATPKAVSRYQRQGLNSRLTIRLDG